MLKAGTSREMSEQDDGVGFSHDMRGHFEARHSHSIERCVCTRGACSCKHVHALRSACACAGPAAAADCLYNPRIECSTT